MDAVGAPQDYCKLFAPDPDNKGIGIGLLSTLQIKCHACTFLEEIGDLVLFNHCHLNQTSLDLIQVISISSTNVVPILPQLCLVCIKIHSKSHEVIFFNCGKSHNIKYYFNRICTFFSGHITENIARDF